MNTATLQVRVARKQVEAVDICSFELVAAGEQALPAFSAGSHIDVYLPNGITRQYSLCNDPEESHRYLIAVLKDSASRGGSVGMHDLVHVGDFLKISAPRNHFPLAHGSTSNLLFAGGIGITPILCMAERLAMAGETFEMHYSTRSLERTAFHQRIAQATFAQHVFFHHDDGAAEQKINLSSLLGTKRAGVHVYVCGPKGFMDAVLETARRNGWPEAQLHYEFFSAAPAKFESDGRFELKLASSGRIVTVEKDQSVVQALEAVGVTVLTSCEQGVCGTCLTRVLEGEPDHRDMYLSPEEQARNDQFLPCCSRSKSPMLVLDL